ncbi:MAG: surface-adhesin E family protein [Nitrospirota bacterium]
MKQIFQIIIGIIIIFVSSSAGAEEWRLFDHYNDHYYYDKESINYPLENSREIIGVWQKVIFNDESLDRIISHLGPKYADLVEVISLIEINCYTKHAQIKSKAYYDKRGNAIDTMNKTRSDWKAIEATSPLNQLYYAVCPVKPSKK